ncbi:hypothetical protein ACWEPC_54995 [Nonomuraea sp. NPDC004297]
MSPSWNSVSHCPPPGRWPDPEPEPTRARGPLVSLSVSVSLGLPLLGGDGDGLLNADIGLGLGTSLLGFVVVPGTAVLLGGRIAVRRARRRRSGEMPEVTRRSE